LISIIRLIMSMGFGLIQFSEMISWHTFIITLVWYPPQKTAGNTKRVRNTPIVDTLYRIHYGLMVWQTKYIMVEGFMVWS
jgi:hypothetical protein